MWHSNASIWNSAFWDRRDPPCVMLTSQRKRLQKASVAKRWLSYTLKLVTVLSFKLLFVLNTFLAFCGVLRSSVSVICLHLHRRMGMTNVNRSCYSYNNKTKRNFWHCANKKLIRRWDSERELSLRRGKTTVLDRHQIRLRVTSRVRLAVRFGSLSYDDIVHAVQNTIDSCINSTTDRRGYVFEHRFTKFSDEITTL